MSGGVQMGTGTRSLLVVGSGIAGLYAALLGAEAGLAVTLVTKGALAHSNTHLAQGGICAVLGPDEAASGDSVGAHIADTLAAGAGHCDPEAVRILCAEAHADIAALERHGVVFDRDPATGRRALGLEGAHSAARILHAGGDATGAAIADGLIAAVRAVAGGARRVPGSLRVVEHAFVLDLMTNDGGPGSRVTGVALVDGGGGLAVESADAVLLATGGAGQLFEFTTNPSVATADGLALAWRAGAAVADLEFFQFHPTALAGGDNFLVSEAVRGAGAVLRDARGEAFMVRYHPDGDLAPRDVVSRGITAHLGATPGATVFLDATGVERNHGAGFLARRFPTIDATTRELGLDWTREWLPVTPAAHYWMGGVATDLDARTTLPGLYAAGEVACTGVHGANRLASNSLLEGLVFGRRAVAAAIADSARGGDVAATFPARILDIAAAETADTADTANRDPGVTSGGRAELQRLLSAQAGVVRSGRGLRDAARALAGGPGPGADDGGDAESAVAAAELANLRLAGVLLVHAALARPDSLGAHHRDDARADATGGNHATGRHANYWVAAAETAAETAITTTRQRAPESETV
ncbi:L-aspartate oxidase [Specibacter cremeus]|uniref:L-aspartate oxidase n=1 Tax=Specibacter cremeus TaxID=1629051 RepID=UPI000F77504C|nr:L-aspartate oxidase [Specibacter cremeus]